jgi:hypothetical protein
VLLQSSSWKYRDAQKIAPRHEQVQGSFVITRLELVSVQAAGLESVVDCTSEAQRQIGHSQQITQKTITDINLFFPFARSDFFPKYQLQPVV